MRRRRYPPESVSGFWLAKRPEVEALDQLGHAPGEIHRARPEVARRDGQVLLDREVAVERVVLGAHADRALRPDQIPPQLDPVHVDLAGVRAQESVEHAQRRGLAGAVRPEQAQDLPGLASEVDAVHDPLPTEMLHQATRFEERAT